MSDLARKANNVAQCVVLYGTIAIILFSLFGNFYNGLNAGVVFGTDAYHVGFEWKGVFGPFADFGKIHFGR